MTHVTVPTSSVDSLTIEEEVRRRGLTFKTKLLQSGKIQEREKDRERGAMFEIK